MCKCRDIGDAAIKKGLSILNDLKFQSIRTSPMATFILGVVFPIGLFSMALRHALFLECHALFSCSMSFFLTDRSLFSLGTVSGSGTGPLDYGATGPVPDTEPRL